jgi:ribosomal protein L14E/L6E/L27E
MGRAARQAGDQRHCNGESEMNTTQEKIRSTKAQFRIAVKQYNQSQRLMERLKKSLDQLEKKRELEIAKSKAKHANRG